MTAHGFARPTRRASKAPRSRVALGAAQRQTLRSRPRSKRGDRSGVSPPPLSVFARQFAGCSVSNASPIAVAPALTVRGMLSTSSEISILQLGNLCATSVSNTSHGTAMDWPAAGERPTEQTDDHDSQTHSDVQTAARANPR